VNISRWAALPAAAAICLGAAACGSGGSGTHTASPPPRPSVLAEQVRTALQQAKSVHIDGTVRQRGRNIALSLSMTRSGGVSGQITLNGASVGVLSTGGSTYIRMNSGFIKYLKLPQTVCTLVCGKYLKANATQSRSLLGYLSMDRLFGSMTRKTPSFHYGSTQTINGQAAWVLHSSNGGTAYVAANGTHYPLRFVAPNRGQLNFTQWNSVKIPAAPPASKVVDLSQLHH